MKEGLEAGDKAALTLDQQQRAERLRWLGEAGVNPEAAEQRGQLEVRRRENAHLRSGRFDQHAMITYAIVGGILQKNSFYCLRTNSCRSWSAEVP